MFRIAITGGMACGKSLVGALLREQGVAVCEADELAHRLMEPGHDAYRKVVSTFGEGVLDADGRIDRRVLGRRVFENAAERARLNAIVHPGVRLAWEQWLARGTGGGDLAAVIVPLLFEAGMETGWDAVVCVTAPRDSVWSRMLAREYTGGEVRRRLASQWPVEIKVVRSDYVVCNFGTVDLLREQGARIVRSIRERGRWQRDTTI